MGSQTASGGPTMCGTLRRVLVCSPEAAGWGDPRRAAAWRDLGYRRPPDAGLATAQHAALRRCLVEAGAEVVDLPPDESLTLDAVYTHDPSFLTGGGLLVLRMGKAARAGEPARQAARCRELGVPVVAEMRAPATAEGGDLVWLDPGTVLAGRGHRTSAAGIEWLRHALRAAAADVVEAPLPHGAGPGECLHLMSLLSVLDPRTLLVDLPMLAVSTVELLQRRGFRLMPIDPAERSGMAVNVLSLGERRVLAMEENLRTNDTLRREGFDVRTFPGSELCWNGGGGPTCLTRPLLRDGDP